MVLKFYYDFLSQPCRALYIFLKENNIPFEPVSVRLGNGDHRTEEFRKINPLRLVPVIDDNGFILRESVGILRYLCKEKNVAEHWYPKETRAQAKVDEYLEWQHLGLRFPCSAFFRTVWLEPITRKQKPLESDVAKLEKLMIHSCDLFENEWLKDGSKFIYGEELTIADLLASTELEQPRLAGYDPRDGRPKLTAYMKHVEEATNPHYTEAHIFFNKLVKKFNMSKL